MITASPTPSPRPSWSFVIDCLAWLGETELERRAKAQQADEQPRRDDEPQAQPDAAQPSRDQA